jgi:hypothetical protein
MITFKITGLDAVRAHLAGLGKQVSFATAQALTQTAGKIKEATPDELEKALDRPVTFTKRGLFVRRATRANLTAVVGFMPAQAAYMRYQIEGGTRNPGPEGLKLPAAINTDAFGNIPKGIIGKLIAVARKERKLAKVTTRRIKVSNKVELFYGDPKDQTGKDWPRGIYKAVGGRLIPLVVFPNKPARYKPRFDFQRLGETVARREFDALFAAALKNAMASAR